MPIKLDPHVSEFKSTEAAENYDRWFRAKIKRAVADTRPTISHDQVMARAHAAIEAAAKG
ncbi:MULTISPECIES: type II toxin-antitoxin system RelB family antitoxin [Xanthomonas]|uniref:type II toxin-antitoxin system RelB family antitoxin n=1 Tax=Xanthomonas TaxID=338 RepID=UPI001ADC1E73|nr:MULTISPECIES: antitoxin [unclassified Xanthomonas]MBO9873535.1 antitoxin [Xanthomonas sp. D-93]WNH45317.1 antitoxin [Xanthomonas sp. A6251]